MPRPKKILGPLFLLFWAVPDKRKKCQIGSLRKRTGFVKKRIYFRFHPMVGFSQLTGHSFFKSVFLFFGLPNYLINVVKNFLGKTVNFPLASFLYEESKHARRYQSPIDISLLDDSDRRHGYRKQKPVAEREMPLFDCYTEQWLHHNHQRKKLNFANS